MTRTRYLMSETIADFGAKIDARVGGLDAASVWIPMGMALGDELFSAGLTFVTNETPASNATGTLRFAMEVADVPLAPLGPVRVNYRALTEHTPAQVTRVAHIFSNRAVILNPIGGALAYQKLLYLRVDAHTRNPAAPSLWEYITSVTLGAEFRNRSEIASPRSGYDDSWLRDDLEFEPAAQQRPFDYRRFEN